MYVKALLTLLVLLAAAIVVALARPRAAPPAGEADSPLDVKVPVMKFDGLPLGEAVTFLHETTGANIVVRWDVLADHGLARDTPVDADLRDVTLGAALRAAFEQRRKPAANGVDWPLTYDARDGVVTVADARDPPPLVVRVYDVRDLIGDDYFSHLPRKPPGEGPYSRTGEPDGPEARTEALIYLIRAAGLGGVPFGGGGYFSPTTVPSFSPTIPAAAGPVTSVSGYAGRLVVVETPEGQRDVETILWKLREAK